MNETETNKVLRHSASAIAIPLGSNDQMFPSNNRAIRPFSSLYPMIPGVMNPHSTSVQIWSKVFIFLYFFTFLLQTLGIFLSHVNQDKNCIADYDTLLVRILYFLLGCSSCFILMYIIFKFRVAYVDTESRVYNREKVSLNYLLGYFFIDLFLALPLTPRMLGLLTEMSNWSAGLVEVLSFLQYLAVLCRLVSMFSDQPTSAFFFESWSSKFVLNLLAFFLFSHVVGSFWYLFALHRVEKCLQEACGEPWCLEFTFCGPIYLYTNEKYKNDSRSWTKWKKNDNATACFGPGGFDYGIYEQAVSLMKNSNLPMRYIYSLFWGFQQISTLAGNQTPAFFHVEVLFTMFITATGLLLFSFLSGNMQNFLQALGRGSLEKSVRGLDVENVVILSEGDVCGEELVKLCLEHYVLNRDGGKFKIPAQKLVSKRMVRCLRNVEAFTLRAADLEEVFSFYSGLLVKNPLLQGAIKKESLNPKSLPRSRSY